VNLDAIADDDLTTYLRLRSWIPDTARVRGRERAGEGNMNLVLRVHLDTGDSLVLKHGRPWVEKYPSISAPANRSLVEGAFYAVVHDWPAVASRMPRCIGLDRSDRILALEDCGAGRDFSDLYRGAAFSRSDLETLVSYLLTLHGIPLDADRALEMNNHEMRALNHVHMFRLPLEAGNGIDLDAVCPGMRAAADELAGDATFVTRVHALGEAYLAATGPSLLHGDFFPGSWLRTPTGIRLIDPEFCFPGPPEFDLGVCVAHLRLAGLPPSLSDDALTAYRRASAVTRAEVAAWAGVEIMRRLIGVAQLPLRLDLAARRTLLNEARGLVLGLHDIGAVA
jgi:5-methylthioribose kinase